MRGIILGEPLASDIASVLTGFYECPNSVIEEVTMPPTMEEDEGIFARRVARPV